MKRSSDYMNKYPKSKKQRAKPYSKPETVIPMTMGGGINQQAKRTGGWANPSRMGEKKFVDVVPTFAPPAASTSFTTGALLNGISNGSGASERIGRKATIKSLLLRFTATCGTVALPCTGGGCLRILVVHDKQTNATAPLITDILVSDTFNSANNLSNRDRFTTIFDFITPTITTDGPEQVSDVLYKRLNLETFWNAGTDALIGSISTGSIYMFVAQSGFLATNPPQLTAYIRTRYVDT